MFVHSLHGTYQLGNGQTSISRGARVQLTSKAAGPNVIIGYVLLALLSYLCNKFSLQLQMESTAY